MADTKREITERALEIAEENDVDLELVPGTGKDGRILVDDVRGVIRGRRLMQKYVEVSEWSGQKNYTCTLTRYSTLDRSRMIEHINALDSKGLIPDEESGEEEESNGS